jgi:phosphatidylserine/phosphatidylglycerophosphate/cardiolipin synthase-like enzyme
VALDNLALLDRHKASPFAPGYPAGARTFYSPVDDVHAVLIDLVSSATKSLVVAMYGYDDEELNTAIKSKTANPDIFVQLSLDSSQAGVGAEVKILHEWDNKRIGNSIAVGHSEKSAIMHLKMVIVDGLDVVTGSTNWSAGGENKQDNQLTVIRDALVAAEARTRLDVIHDHMLKQMAAKAAQK